MFGGCLLVAWGRAAGLLQSPSLILLHPPVATAVVASYTNQGVQRAVSAHVPETCGRLAEEVRRSSSNFQSSKLLCRSLALPTAWLLNKLHRRQAVKPELIKTTKAEDRGPKY